MTDAPARTVSLTIPPKPDYIVLARLALSAVCRLTPLAADDVADLKLAVTEVATGRLETGADDDLRMLVELEDDRLVVELDGPAPGASDDGLSHAIVEATVDEAEYGASAVRLVKRLRTAGEE